MPRIALPASSQQTTNVVREGGVKSYSMEWRQDRLRRYAAAGKKRDGLGSHDVLWRNGTLPSVCIPRQEKIEDLAQALHRNKQRYYRYATAGRLNHGHLSRHSNCNSRASSLLNPLHNHTFEHGGEEHSGFLIKLSFSLAPARKKYEGQAGSEGKERRRVSDPEQRNELVREEEEEFNI